MSLGQSRYDLMKILIKILTHLVPISHSLTLDTELNGELVRKPGICHRLLRDRCHLLTWQPWTYHSLSVLLELNVPFRTTEGKRHL